jgi:hypothetical protein
LIAIDGICRHELGEEVYALQSETGVKARRLKQQILIRMGVTEAEEQLGLRGPEVDALLTVFRGMSGKGGPAVLNRHEVLHGARPSIGSLKDSLQGLLCLEVVHWLLTLRDIQDVGGRSDAEVSVNS